MTLVLPRGGVLVTRFRVRMAGGQALSAALAFAIVAVATSSLFGVHGIAHLLRLRSEREALSGDAFALLQTNRRLHEDIRRLRSDDLYLEELARRRLGLVKPNETVYRFRRRDG